MRWRVPQGACLGAVWAIALIALPKLAHACPTCANTEDGGYGRLIVIGLMILFPFTVAFVVYRVLKAADGAVGPRGHALGTFGTDGVRDANDGSSPAGGSTP